MNTTLRLIPLLWGAWLLSGCASKQYGYFPVGTNEIIESNERGVTFPTALGNSKANLHLMSFGIVDLYSGTKKGINYPTLHLRMRVENNSGSEDLAFNARDQKVKLSGSETSIPAFIKATTDHFPEVTVPKGKSLSVDLFYPLPKAQQTAQAINGFDFEWKISKGTEVYQKTIPFVRIQTHIKRHRVHINPAAQQQGLVEDELEMSPGLWFYDPFYPGMAFPEVGPYPAFP